MALHSGYCSLHPPEPFRSPRLRDRLGSGTARALLYVGLLGLAVSAYFAIDWLGESLDSNEWKADDRVALGSAALLGLVFTCVGFELGARQSRLAGAAALAQIEERMHRMRAASLLALKSGASCGLEVAQNALAVLPTLRLVDQSRQGQFLEVLTECYGTLTLNAFPRNRSSPLIEIHELRRTTAELIKGLQSLTASKEVRVPREAVQGVVEMLEDVLDLEEWFRRGGDGPETVELQTLQRLYSRELQSYCCWSDDTIGLVAPAVRAAEPEEPVVHRAGPLPGGELSATRAVADVRRCTVASTRHFLSPWYLSTAEGLKTKADRMASCDAEYRPERDTERLGGGQQTYSEVDYSKHLREDASSVTTAMTFNRYPAALTHDEVRRLPEFRDKGISHIRKVLQEAWRGDARLSITILTYEICVPEQGSVTVVLDGNHRLAALQREPDDVAAAMSVIVFRLGEQQDHEGAGARAPSTHQPANPWDCTWSGFNPDVHLAKLPAPLGTPGP